MANTRADVGPIGQLPTFGDSQVPQSPDINSYSDRLLAREAGRPAEIASRAFEGLSNRLGVEADQDAHYEGTMAGRVAGMDPNYRPNQDESLRGRAFNQAATETYLNNVDAQSKQAASTVYDQYMLLPPAQRQPALLQQNLQKVQDDFTKNHLFPEIQGEFNARFANLSTAYLQGAQRDLEKNVHDAAEASFMAKDAANADTTMRIAGLGLDSVKPQLDAALNQSLGSVDQAVASGAITAVQGVERKQAIRDNAWLADKAARYNATPDQEKPAFRDAVNKQAPPPGAAPPANWSDGVNFGKAGPFSYPTSANDPIGDDVKSSLAALRQNFGQPFTLTSTTNGQHADGSYHYQGKAVDVSIAGMDGPTLTRFVDSARAAGFTGFGLGATHIHLDTRPSNGAAVVFPDAYNGPVAGKDIGDWQAHLNNAPAPARSSAQAAGPSFAALQKFNTYADAADRQAMSQANQLEKGQIGEINAAAKQIVAGYAVPDQQWEAMRRDYAGNPNPNVAQAWTAADNLRTTLAGFKGMKPDAVEATLANAQGALANGATPDQVERLKAGQEYLKRLREDLASDPLSRAARDGVISNLAPLDASSPDALQKSLVARQAQVDQVSQHYDVAPKYLMQNERGLFKTLATNGGPAMVQAAGAVTQALGPRAEGFFREVGADAPNFALAGKVTAIGGDPQFTADLAERARLNNDAAAKSGLELPARAPIDDALRSTYGTALAMLPEFGGQAASAARQVYELRAFRQGVKPDPSSPDFTQAAQEAVGARFQGSTQYGGVASYGGMFAGAPSQKVLIPPTIRADRFADVVGAVGDKDLTALPAPPVASDGKTPIPAAMIQRGYLTAVGDGRYAVSMGAPTSRDPQWVRDPSGQKFVLDLKAMEPALRQRAPEAYAGVPQS
jgi:hypothetical protein